MLLQGGRIPLSDAESAAVDKLIEEHDVASFTRQEDDTVVVSLKDDTEFLVDVEGNVSERG